MNQLASVERLLELAKAAHGEYERDVLNGVYDQDWPQWYAEFMVGEGLGSLLGREVSADEVAQLFVTSWDDFKASESEAAEVWTVYTARRMVDELGG